VSKVIRDSVGLRLWDITAQTCSIACFIIFNYIAVHEVSCLELFVEYDRNNFYVPSCVVSLVNAIKPETSEGTAAILLCYIMHNTP